jgi:hypothetical protein
MHISAGLEHPGSAHTHHRGGHKSDSSCKHSFWEPMLLKLLPHMIRFCTPFAEIVFDHCNTPPSGFP